MRAAWLILVVALFLAPPARADATVTLCAADDQAGAGTNLSAALAVGGRVTFACGAAATILMNCHAQIATDTEIDGAGHVTLRVNVGGPGCSSPTGSVHFALFHDPPGKTLALKLTGLNLVGLKAPPKAVTSTLPGQLVFGNLALTITGSTIQSWTSPIFLSTGQAIVDSSTLSNNDGVVLAAPTLVVRHGTIFSNNGGVPLRSTGGTVLIDGGRFTGNRSGSQLNACTSIDIHDSNFDSNTSATTGGALSVGCNTRISGGMFKKNQARSGGALYIGDGAQSTNLVGVTFEGNQASADGGAVAMRYEIYPPLPPAQTVALHGVTFRSNAAQIAGALEVARDAAPGTVLANRTLTAAGTQFIDNHATIAGGGLLFARAQAVFDGVVFVGNRADKGGGALVSLQRNDGGLELANTLLVQNVSPLGAAVLGHGVTFVNSTLADNNGPAISGATAAAFLPPVRGIGPQPIGLQNTIVAAGTGAACGPMAPDVPIIDEGNNLQSGGNACGATIAVGSPRFGPSYIPLPGSPAAHGGNDAVCAAAPVAGRDLWGEVRPNSGHCAIGAAESNISQMVNQAGGPVLQAVGAVLRCACWKK